MRRKFIPIQIVTWNVARRDAEVLNALKKASDRIGKVDLVTLQEVRTDVADVFRKYLLEKMDFTYVHYDSRLDIPCQNHINVIASRWPLRAVGLRYPRRKLPWPQALSEVLLKVDGQSIVLITAHIPNGRNYGWQKIDAFKVLNKIVGEAKRRPCIVTGDFNEPQYAIRHGRVLTWGQKEGRFEYCEDSKDDLGRLRTGKEWDDAVRWLFEKEDEHGLSHAYWEAHGPGSMSVSHSTTNSRKRWFDHIFVSRKFFRVRACKYFHQLRRAGLSDHSALSAKLMFDCRVGRRGANDSSGYRSQTFAHDCSTNRRIGDIE